MCAFMIFVRCCVVPLFHTEFITFIVSHLSLPLLSRARQFFSKKLSPIRDCCLCSFRHKIFISHSSKRTFLQIHTHTHKRRKKKRNKQRARDITFIVAMNSTPLPTSREYVLCVLTLLIFFFFESFPHPPPPCFYFCVRVAYV